MSDIPQAEHVAANTAQNGTSSRRILLIIVGVLAGFIVLCGLGAILLFGTIFFDIKNTSSDVKPVLEQFMQTMERKDADAAYGLFSQRAQQQIGVQNLESLLSETNYPLFEGYQSLTINNINISTRTTTNQNEAQGLVATIAGKTHYQGGIEGRFEATLEQEDGEWRFHVIDVTVPPEKLR